MEPKGLRRLGQASPKGWRAASEASGDKERMRSREAASSLLSGLGVGRARVMGLRVGRALEGECRRMWERGGVPPAVWVSSGLGAPVRNIFRKPELGRLP